MTIRVLVAEDDHLVRAGLVLLLDADRSFEVVADVPDGQAACDAVLRSRPDVAVIDLRVPGMDGVEATRRITADATAALVGHPVEVLVVTNDDLAASVTDAVRAGAAGYLLKRAVPAELHEAVRSVAGGDRWYDPRVTRRLVADLAMRPEGMLTLPASLSALTGREREVLVLIAHGLGNDDIAAHLHVVPATVKSHVNRLFAKLALRDRAQAVGLAYRSGLVTPGDALPPPPGG